MAERLRCAGCSGVAREECDQEFAGAALLEQFTDAFAGETSYELLKEEDGSFTAVDAEPGSEVAMARRLGWADKRVDQLAQSQSDRGCDFTREEIRVALYTEVNAQRSEQPHETARIQSLVDNFLEDIKEQGKE